LELLEPLDLCPSDVSVSLEDLLHPILHLQLALLQRDFFEVFGFGEIRPGGKLTESIFELVMLGEELVKFFVGLQQLLCRVLRLSIHAPPPWTSMG
jgi:hypothetical protein